jgi:hypothetical protein
MAVKAHITAQAAKTPSINAPTEALNQGSCWRRMLDSTYRALTLVKTGFRTSQIAFYAIFLRHLEDSLDLPTVWVT